MGRAAVGRGCWGGLRRGLGHGAPVEALARQAAYQAATMRFKGKDPGADGCCDKTISAFDGYKGSAGNYDEGKTLALGSIQSDMAAEFEYRAIDEDITKNFDYDTDHHRYQGVIVDIRTEFKEDVEVEAKGYYDRLQAVIDKYLSRRWAVAARARQGSLYDSCRTGLYNAREPGLKLYQDEERNQRSGLWTARGGTRQTTPTRTSPPSAE